ncbi:MAG: right-handed parallel beta-helix repeat-containing protein [Bacteroidales bacterium]|nr:right-handed parallel beta-helix repeat-containing protein [Bacteroidales bacterium]
MNTGPCLFLFAFLATVSCNSTVHVSPDGDDGASGRRGAPVKTVGEATRRVSEGGTIVLHGGEYFLDEPVKLEGIEGLTIRAAYKEKPVLRGDRPLTFTQLPEGELAGILPDKVRHKLLVADLAAAGIHDCGNAIGESNRSDLYWNGMREKTARWPDHGFTHAGEVLGIDRPEPDCCMEGIIRYEDARIDRWADEKNGALHGFFRYGWQEYHHTIVSVDPSSRSMTLDATENRFGFRDGFRFYGENILCELDCPGEYYVDGEKGMLYWFPETGYESGNEEVTYSCIAGDFLLDVRNCPGLRLKGITLRGGRDSGIRAARCPKARIQDCEVESFGKDGMHLVYSDGSLIRGCRLHGLGQGGIKVDGGNRKTLGEADVRITRNTISDFSRFALTYQPALLLRGCGMRIDHNEAYKSPSSGIRLEGNDFLLDHNYFHDLVTVSDDQGALDIFGDYKFRGIEIRCNLWEDITGNPESDYGAAAVRLDDLICGVLIKGNRFVNCGAKKFGAIQINGGKDNVIEGNRFIRCATVVSFSPWTRERWEKARDNDFRAFTVPDTVEYYPACYPEKYPALLEDPLSDINRNYIRSNVFEGCGRLFFREYGNNVIEDNKMR